MTIVVAVVAILAMGAGAALAFWGSTDSSNPARAAADALQAGSAPTGSATNQNVTVTWTAGSTVGGHAATGYSVHRYASASGGTAVAATGGCAGTIVALTCTEAGVPAGLWYYTITPSLSLWAGNESARTAVSVNQTPTITTGAGVTFTVGAAASFTVSTTGFPAATISETGTLPSGVTLTNNGNGTATLGGTPAASSGGTYPLTITAANGTLPNATQGFTLTVDQAPAITSASGVTFTVGTAGTFTVQTTGFPTPLTITRSGTLPSNVTFVNNGNGTATLSGTPGTSGVFALTMTASNGVAP
ncbi:MAG TPA: putative Ig domain-containing protein, partial [Mycobacteriales bacterium]|nr:putative Ig domain-containing protein [Mycobacteriales bacterium]